ncbi:beta-lactamase [Candidatus Koribacter versatilis Ellin345]|uniref:Beta-lactamase n=1 Tax=Koribacter versatilis (strain Ellin345) TaxID=204669 RepID=Q1IJX0_KORVE|nr:serine hydrolase domain-containing protein [Candidatus Koribacter versatilis]ABF42830.1 beta-lactamase [Candidatus Koribacter versatilis Ellin345]
MRKLALSLGCIALISSSFINAQNPLPQKTNKEKHPEAAPATSKVVPGESTHELDAADLEAFLDGLVPTEIARNDIAGAVVSVVKDGKIIYEKGYGYADVKTKRPVVANETLFRPGSISKLFTWTAVMQLVEQGKLDLDKEVNEYLDFKIEAAFGQPITLRNIMTHTAGFEEAVKDLITADQNGKEDLRGYVISHQPRRIYPPGKVPAYSNYATTLAGYIVQRVSGEPFDDYIEHHIYQPLHMEHATFRQPLPKGWEANVSSGYDVGSGEAKPYEFVTAFPAGSVAITADDISHFMIAHLQNGEYEGAQILQTATAQKMHSRTFSVGPRLNGMCLGFYQENRNGHTIIGHAGDTQYFHSDLHLILDSNVGFFISQNSAGKPEGGLRETVFHHFLDRYFPYTPPPTTAIASAKQDAARLAGYYMSSRRPGPNLLDALNAIGQSKVGADADGNVIIEDFKAPNGQPRKFVEVEQNLYREQDGQAQLEFFTDYSGAQSFAMDYPFMMWMKPGAVRTKPFALFTLIAPIVFFSLALVLWGVGAAARRHYDKRLNLDPVHARRHRLLMLAAALNLIFIATVVGIFSALGELGLNTSSNWLYRVIQFTALLAVVSTLIAIYNFFRPWWEQRWWWNRVYDVLFVLSAIFMTWFILEWHVLAPSLKF